MKITGIALMKKVSDDQDISHLGYYTDDGDLPGAIRRGHVGRSEYGYFVPATEGDTNAFERAEAHSRGDWHYELLYAELRCEVAGTAQRVRSEGMLAVSDDSEDNRRETYGTELDQLQTIALAWGFNPLDVGELIARTKFAKVT